MTTEGSKITNFTFQCGTKQIINQPTQVLNNFYFCMDLLLTSQPNLVMESAIHASLHSNYHHQTVYARFNLNIYYPPSYELKLWHYKKLNFHLIQQAICEFNWKRGFHRKDINKKVSVLNNTINNVVLNFVPHENINCDDKKPPRIL